MDSDLYEAAITGNLAVLKRNEQKVRDQLTPDNNTVLHLASTFGQTKAVKAILHLHSHSLLVRVNAQGGTALHLAARGGHKCTVRELIEYAKKLDQEEDIERQPKAWQFYLWMVNEEGDTALHEAVRYHHTQVAVMLIEQDTIYSHSSNNSGETPLYLAASRGFVDLVGVIIDKCRSPAGLAYGGPYCTTALHGAVICKHSKNSEDCMEKILKSEELSLTKEVDLYGQSPLHYAAHTDCPNKVSKLLCKDESTVYLADNDKNTALHIAASRGYVPIMRIIILLRPDSCHMVDKKGRNILHIAVKEEKKSAVEFILQHCLMVSSLIVQKDVDGNTPLHLLATTSNCCVKKLIQHNMADKEALNKERLTPLDMVNYSNNINDWSKLRIREELRRAGATSGYPYAKKMNAMIKGMTTTIKEDDPIVKEYVPWDPTKIVDTNAMIKGMTTTIKEDDLIVKEYVPWDPRKIVDTHMLVVTLVATVAFAAGFTLPGGYTESSSTNKGMALLTKETAFKVFMIADTVALVSSIIGVVVYSSATDYISREKIKTLSRIGGGFAIIALTAMMLAFLTGTYVVLSHSPAIAVATLVVGCVSFPAYFGVLIKYLWDYLTYNM